jgi:hypothetical protein
MKKHDLLPGEEDFSAILDDPNFVPFSAGAGYSKNSAAAADRSDAPTGTGGFKASTGTTATGASEKQIAFLTSLATERGVRVEANWLASKASASAAIDNLLATRHPHAAIPGAPKTMAGNPATDKQKTFVRTLLAERAGNEVVEAQRRLLNVARESGNLTADLVSRAITVLLEIPKTPAAEVEAGVYVLANGNLARVYLGQQSGGMLLKEVVDGELEYRGKAERFLAGSRKATIEEVGNWGRTTGTCLVCTRRLDDPESVDRGIGPVCYARMGG